MEIKKNVYTNGKDRSFFLKKAEKKYKMEDITVHSFCYSHNALHLVCIHTIILPYMETAKFLCVPEIRGIKVYPMSFIYPLLSPITCTNISRLCSNERVHARLERGMKFEFLKFRPRFPINYSDSIVRCM